MIRIIDDGNSYSSTVFNDTMFTDIDRKIYLRLQTIVLNPLGSISSDNLPPIRDFIDAMDSYSKVPPENTVAIDEVDEFFGKLGTEIRYPHKDNTYKGIING
jgi:hypothetical protein